MKKILSAKINLTSAGRGYREGNIGEVVFYVMEKGSISIVFRNEKNTLGDVWLSSTQAKTPTTISSAKNLLKSFSENFHP